MICAVALVLLVDVSGSVSAEHHRMQRDGIAAAMRSPDFARVIEGQPPTAVKLIEWDHAARVVMPWRVIANRAEAEAAALAIEQPGRSGNAMTHVGDAIAAGIDALASAPCDEIERQVIDVSGDGQSTGGLDTAQQRDRAAAAGITINGLPIVTPQEPGVADWYRANVVTPDGFVIVAEGWADVARAMRRKLVWEISAR